MESSIHKTVKSIIGIRTKLIKTNASNKNTMLCLKYINELKLYIDAYGQKWDAQRWKNFVIENYDKIIYLIPNTKSGETLKKRLYENVL